MKLLVLLYMIMSCIFTAQADTLKDELRIEVTRYHTNPLGSYKKARQYMFGKIYLEQGKITDVYCEETFDEKDGVGEMKIPNPDILNCEHTHPRSKFNDNMVYNHQLTDLHHLFPTVSSVNSARSNHPFGIPLTEIKTLCSKSRKGRDAKNVIVFEPPHKHKGNVARAKFYFSIRYQVPINLDEEATLRAWHHEDPVDETEERRNEMIRDIQGNLNPFIEYPNLVDKIEDF